jgi:5-methylcytosine-specific restriction endonuclease McrA
MKKCKGCNQYKLKERFVDSKGNPNPRGKYCLSCFKNGVGKNSNEEINDTETITRKYKIIFGEYWEHYAIPYDFRKELYEEREFCPYCGKKLPLSSHTDHMDPLSRGGEESIRNAVIVCGSCNSKKGNLLFVEWLKRLKPKYRKIAREIYVQKHGHNPEEFKEGFESARTPGGYWEIYFYDEKTLKEMYPVPKVQGPPKNKPRGLVISIG